ncbi:MAG: ergothioneine biosynthesis protein EgtB [Planctomycetota bacterium]
MSIVSPQSAALSDAQAEAAHGPDPARAVAGVLQPPDPAVEPDPAGALDFVQQVRAFTETLVAGLEPEDLVVQTQEDCSPGKWHLAHTTWFFERFVLGPWSPGYTAVDPAYDYLFNSYYNGVGPQHCRPRRGVLSRPTVAQVLGYRQEVDRRLSALVDDVSAGRADPAPPKEPAGALGLAAMLRLGAHHEQQHQELLLADLQHAFSSNPLMPAHPDALPARREGADPSPAGWVHFEAGLVPAGVRTGAKAFHFDNETPRIRAWIEPFDLADRLVTCGEYQAFIDDGGYDRPDLWLSAGWAQRQADGWTCPLYWYRDGGVWKRYALSEPTEVPADEPVSHLSYYEADAYARWAGARLPTEFEWEHAAFRARAERRVADDGAYAESMRWTPAPARPAPVDRCLRQMMGVLWQWTSSAYAPYAGYRPLPGVLGEYNGKFMSGQQVLRGAAAITPRSHTRVSYRNFYAPQSRWCAAGLRLARDA